MNKQVDHYQLLHVLPDAPTPVIKASYRAMMQKLRNHPDLGGDPLHAQKLNEAMDTLGDPVKRAAYDQQLNPLSSRHATHAQEPSQAQRETTEPGGQPKPQTSARPPKKDSAYQQQTSSSYSTKQKPGKPHQSSPEPQHNSLPSRPNCLFCKATFSEHLSANSNHPYGNGQTCFQCRAPTTPIEQLSDSSSEELRRIYRHEHQAAVKLWSHWPMDVAQSARLNDLSLAGCAIESEIKLAGDDIVLLEMDALSAICQVRYCKAQTSKNNAIFHIGLEFLTLKITARPGSVFSAVA